MLQVDVAYGNFPRHSTWHTAACTASLCMMSVDCNSFASWILMLAKNMQETFVLFYSIQVTKCCGCCCSSQHLHVYAMLLMMKLVSVVPHPVVASHHFARLQWNEIFKMLIETLISHWFYFMSAVRTEWWGAGVVISVERGADLHIAQNDLYCVERGVKLYSNHPAYSPADATATHCLLLQ